MTEPQLPSFSSLLESIRSSSTNDTNSQTSQRQLTDAFSLLFESSPTLTEHIVPLLIQRLRSTPESEPHSGSTNYATLIDFTIDLVSSLPDDKKSEFIGAHPRIGEVKGLSALSAAEQGQGQPATAPAPTPTPPEVLERLAFLNEVYERRYPGLVYITFVNGRTRAQIRDELEDKLRGEGVLPVVDAPDGIDGLEKIIPHEIGGTIWRTELDRAIRAVRDIAHSRLEKLGVE